MSVLVKPGEKVLKVILFFEQTGPNISALGCNLGIRHVNAAFDAISGIMSATSAKFCAETFIGVKYSLDHFCQSYASILRHKYTPSLTPIIIFDSSNQYISVIQVAKQVTSMCSIFIYSLMVG